MTPEIVSISSGMDRLSAALFKPAGSGPFPSVIICHACGDWKENYYELADAICSIGITVLAVDMRGHGNSSGAPYHLHIKEWREDVQSALSFLENKPYVNKEALGAFGFSSGGTAVIEAALIDARLKALVLMDATIRNTAPAPILWIVKLILLIGKIKLKFTGQPIRIPMAAVGKVMPFASDPAARQYIDGELKSQGSFWPLPGGEESVFVDTINRIKDFSVPSLVLWGEEDKVDSSASAKILFERLAGPKRLHIISGNGHMGHLDRHKNQVFDETIQWFHGWLNKKNKINMVIS